MKVKKVIRTFARKKKPSSAPLSSLGQQHQVPIQVDRLNQSLSNRLSMTVGMNVQFSVAGADIDVADENEDDDDDDFSSAIKTATERTYRQLNRMGVPIEERPEFRTLLKALVGKEAEDHEYLQKLQRALGIQVRHVYY